MVRGDCNALPEGSGVYSGGEGPFCRNDRYATLRLQAVLVKAMPSQSRMKQHELLYEYQLISRIAGTGGTGHCDRLEQNKEASSTDSISIQIGYYWVAEQLLHFFNLFFGS
ncbi:UNVERIFIED_CONTAM: hypothetical protein FKN15_062251 [Acipenser sinensis]